MKIFSFLKRFIQPHSLRQKIFIANLLIVIGAFVLFGTFLMYTQFQSSCTQNLAINRTAFENIEYFVTEKTGQLKRTVNTVALDAEVTSILTQPNEVLKASEWYTMYNKLQEICLTNTSVSSIENFFVVSDNAFASYFESNFLISYQSLSSTNWAQQLDSFEGDCFFQTADILNSIHHMPSNFILITFPYPFQYYGQSTYFLGYVDPSVFEELLLADTNNQYTSYVLLNTNGEVLAKQVLEGYEEPLNFLLTTNLEQEQSLQKSINGRTYYLDTSIINGTNLVLVSIQEYDRMVADILSQNINTMLLILIILLPFVTITSYSITISLTRRLDMLMKHMHQVSKGNFDMQRLSVNSTDEISLLNQSFNYMASRISILLDEKLSIGKRLKEQELIALQAQINPHFLYNTLDLIQWKAIKNHDKEIETLVNCLSDYYRLALSKGKEYVPLRAELAHIKAYVYIQNQRFDGQITLKFQVSEDAMEYLFPKLTLQPIVENAILHGILETEEQTGCITISCHIEEEKMLLTVADDGIGMTPETASSLFDKAPGETVLSSGYGLYNIRERIRLTYGLQWDAKIESTPGDGTKVTLILPAKCPIE